MTPPSQQAHFQPTGSGCQSQYPQEQHQAQQLMMQFGSENSQAQHQQQHQQQQEHNFSQFHPPLHSQLHPNMENMGAQLAMQPQPLQPPAQVLNGNNSKPSNDHRLSNTPGIISIEKHEHVIKMLRSSHEETVRRLNMEIESLKSKVRSAKESERDTKRKAQEELKDAIKGRRNKRQRSGDTDAVPTNKHDIKWQARYEELKTFAQLRGHVNVNKNEEGYKDLWQWCQTQRTGYANLTKGQETNLSPHRIKLLNTLNFQWVRSKTPALKWDERFEQLKQFRKKHGHVRIPQKLNEPIGLGNWVLEQRRRYREKDLPELQRKSKKGPLTTEQIKKLESIDFEWSLRNR